MESLLPARSTDIPSKSHTFCVVRAVTVSLALLGEPPLSALLAIPILHEQPPRGAVAGGALIVVGIAIAVLERPTGVAATDVEI